MKCSLNFMVETTGNVVVRMSVCSQAFLHRWMCCHGRANTVLLLPAIWPKHSGVGEQESNLKAISASELTIACRTAARNSHYELEFSLHPCKQQQK